MTKGGQHAENRGVSGGTTGPYAADPSYKVDFWTKLKNMALNWSMRIGAGIFFVLILLFETHLLPLVTENPVPYIFLLVALMLILSERFTELKSEVLGGLENLRTVVANLHQNLNAEIYTLETTNKELLARLRTVQPGQRVVIQHFGLDMVFAWERTKILLRALPNLTDIDYRILMLSGDHKKIHGAGKDIKMWMERAAQEFAKIESEKDAIIRECAQKRRTLSIKVCRYTTLPTVHGIRVLEPIQLAYIAFCRWSSNDHQDYSWGGDSYHRIIGMPLDPSQADLVDIFDGNFNHYWDLLDNEASVQAPETGVLLNRGSDQSTR